DDEKEPVGKVTLSVDWKKHEVLAKSDSGREFKIDISKGSVSEQISRVYKHLIEFTKELRKFHNVQEVKAMYHYRPEIYTNEERLQEVRRSLGTSPGIAPVIIQSSDIEGSLTEEFIGDVSIYYTAQDLSELGLTIEFLRQRRRRRTNFYE